MSTIDDFIALLRDELGLAVTEQDTALRLDQIEGWDSVHLLSLLALLEWRTGRELDMASMLEAETLNDLFAAAAA